MAQRGFLCPGPVQISRYPCWPGVCSTSCLSKGCLKYTWPGRRAASVQLCSLFTLWIQTHQTPTGFLPQFPWPGAGTVSLHLDDSRARSFLLWESHTTTSPEPSHLQVPVVPLCYLNQHTGLCTVVFVNTPHIDGASKRLS